MQEVGAMGRMHPRMEHWVGLWARVVTYMCVRWPETRMVVGGWEWSGGRCERAREWYVFDNVPLWIQCGM